jgi:hypothetical protein
MTCDRHGRPPANERAQQAQRPHGMLQLSLFDERNLAGISSLEYPNERLIVYHNP